LASRLFEEHHELVDRNSGSVVLERSTVKLRRFGMNLRFDDLVDVASVLPSRKFRQALGEPHVIRRFGNKRAGFSHRNYGPGTYDQGEDAYIGTTIGPEERIDIVARLRIGSQDVHCT
jgi:hypothetical protein